MALPTWGGGHGYPRVIGAARPIRPTTSGRGARGTFGPANVNCPYAGRLLHTASGWLRALLAMGALSQTAGRTGGSILILVLVAGARCRRSKRGFQILRELAHGRHLLAGRRQFE